MVDAIGGSAISTQLQSSTTLSVAAIRNEKEQGEAVVRALDQSTREVRHADAVDRGHRVDVRA